MRKFKFGESVKVGDDAVEFGAEFGLSGLSRTVAEGAAMADS
jgi:hypothetical protein